MARTYLDSGEVFNKHIADAANIGRAKLAQRSNGVLSVPLTAWRVWNALETNLPGTPASDDLGIITGTWGSDAPYIGTGDLKAAGATTRRAAALLPLPPDYEADETVTIRVHAGMKTTISDGTATLDVEVWRIDKDGTLGSADLYAGAAQDINDLTADAYDFVLADTTLEPGDQLYVRLSISVSDGATATAVIGAVWQVEVLADLR